ncbi:cytochrome C biogenesis protein CycH [Dysgonomonas sp. 216]|uniref:RhuM family protein n=1 Tax=Dysgonomonas sp. 216 TaxID=2302934 RepID=UPI0013D6872B|nr:RhuM family protein [Dysgonomonas sp. 216]NDW19654.1 cytochrome C biogenesis protein CycH [Dysgonomonas sp. 216]
MNKGEVIIYKSPDGTTNLDVKLENETVWLSQAQMAELFETTPQNITLHISNVYKEGELEQMSTCKDFLQVRQEGKRQVQRNLSHYNLDIIISVGYRVKSQRGTQFRIWANRVLKEYLVKGFVMNRQAKVKQLQEALDSIKMLTGIASKPSISDDQAKGILQVITDYAHGLDILDQYDHQQLTIEPSDTKEQFRATYASAKDAIKELYKKFGGGNLFGNEKDDSFKSSINTIYQTFDGIELYPGVEEKAAMLLYLVTKNHSFSDGNKRIAAFLFIWFLDKNGILYNSDGSKRIENNALVPLTLMIAESKTEEKDMMVKVIVNLIG